MYKKKKKQVKKVVNKTCVNLKGSICKIVHVLIVFLLPVREQLVIQL